MKKSKQTKRALISSVLALVLCFVMLLGTTFAWFTDNASTSVNKVQAGKLDVALEMKVTENGQAKWVSAEGRTLDFVKASGAAKGEEILWEPGCTYKLPAVRVVNKGNLALKYKVVISAVNGDTKLAEVLSVTIQDGVRTPADTDTVMLDKLLSGAVTMPEKHLDANKPTEAQTISMTMDQNAGNTCQGLSIDGIAITVVATQDTVEVDSNNNQYDKDATFANVWNGSVPSATEAESILSPVKQDNVITISTAEQLVAWAQVANQTNYQTVTVKLANDISLAGYEWTPIDLWFTANNNRNITIDGQGHTIFGLTAGATTQGTLSVSGFIGRFNAGQLTVKDLTFANANVKAGTYAGVVIGYQYGRVTLDNVNVLNSTLTSDAISPAELHIGGLVGASMIHDESSGVTLTLKNCTVSGCGFKGYTDTCGLVGMLADYKNHTSSYSTTGCAVTGCTFDWGSSTSNQNFAVSNGASVVSDWTAITYNEYPDGVTVTDCTYQ